MLSTKNHKVIQNKEQTKKYKILIAVNDSPNNRKAIKYGVRIAQAFDVPVEAITVSETESNFLFVSVIINVEYKCCPLRNCPK